MEHGARRSGHGQNSLSAVGPTDRRHAVPSSRPEAGRTAASASSARTRRLLPLRRHQGQLVAKRGRVRRTRDFGRALAARVQGVARSGARSRSDEEIGERLSKRLALPIFSSDAISSSAYATEEILRVLVLAGAGALAALDRGRDRDLAPAGGRRHLSYRQVCQAFPNGGGAYAVARPELTPLLGLVAAAALLIDYVMTVAVSTSSAMDQLISIAPGLDAVPDRDRASSRSR